MRQLPNGTWYEAADLGFDNTLIAAAGFVDGPIVAWCSGFRFSSVALSFEINSGSSVNFNIEFLSFDVDGSTELSLVSRLVATISQTGWILFSAHAPTSVSANTGSAFTTRTGRIMGSPYAQFRLSNSDGANAGNVTLRALLIP